MGADTSGSTDPIGDEIPAIGGINITPFVDVVLVLLVIFMVTAPLLNKDVFGIVLPKASNGEQKVIQSFAVAVTKQGQLLVNGELVTDEVLISKAKQELQAHPDVQALISADGEAKHSDVVKAIDLVKGAGISHFALQLEKAQ